MSPGAPEQRGDRSWRWVVRYAGLTGFGLSLALLGFGEPVPVWLPLLSGTMMGLDSIEGFQLRRREGDKS